MNKIIARKSGIYTLILTLLLTGMPQNSFAGLIGTGAVVAQQNPQQARMLNRFLDSSEVREQLLSMGVPAKAVQARIASLTESELQQLNQQINSLPAGGNVLGIIGAVFVILIILELVGITDIFKKL